MSTVNGPLTPGESLAWEFRRQFQWQMVTQWAAILVVPLILTVTWVTAWLRNYIVSGNWPGGWELPPELHLAMLVVQLLATVLTTLPVCAPVARQFVLPVSTRQLVLSALIHGTLGIAVTLVGTTLVINLLTGARYPVVAPVLYGSLALAAGMWVQLKSRGREWWGVLLGSLIAGLIYLALLQHFVKVGTLVVAHAFTPVTASELAGVVGLTAVFWGAAVRAGGAARAGVAWTAREAWIGLGFTLPEWLAVWIRWPAAGGRRGAVWTLLEWEWRTQSWPLILTAVGVTLLLFGTLAAAALMELWRTGYGGSDALFHDSTFGVAMGLSVFGGLLNLGLSRRGRDVLLSAKSSRWPLVLPASDLRFADVAVARAVLTALVVAAVVLVIGCAAEAIVYWAVQWFGAANQRLEFRWPGETTPWPQLVHQLIVGAIFVWVVNGLCETAILTGRRGWAVLPVVAVFVIPGLIVTAELMHVRPEVMLGLTAVLVLVAVYVSVQLFWSVYPGQWSRVAFAAAVWVAAGWAITVLTTPTSIGQPRVNDLPADLALLGALTLPLLLAPVAVAANRHR
jgi:hypothetical protein